MSASKKSLLRTSFAVILGAGALTYGVLVVQRVVSVDPLKRLKDSPDTIDTPGVEMTNFDWKAFNGSTLVAQAHVAKATVGRNREEVQLKDVTKGQYFEAEKFAFGFQATNAVYLNYRNALRGHGKSRVFNDQMDLVSSEFYYDPSKKALVVPTSLVGKLQGGDVKAENLTYRVEDKSFVVGTIKWEGKIGQEQNKKNWHFETLDRTQKTLIRGPVTTFGKLKATDGEVIILSDTAEYNRETDVLTVKGHVQYFGPDANLVCDQAVVYRKEKRAVMTSNVDMLVKPKQDGKATEVDIPPVTPVVPEKIAKDRPVAPPGDDVRKNQEKQLRTGENLRDYPIAVTAQRIEYFYEKGKRKALISGNPQARQELPDGAWRMLWADRGTYDGEAETLDLRSKGDAADVRMLNSLGDDMHAISVLVSTKEGNDTMDADGLTMDIQVDEDELPEGRDKKNGDGGGAQKPPPLEGPIGRKKG